MKKGRESCLGTCHFHRSSLTHSLITRIQPFRNPCLSSGLFHGSSNLSQHHLLPMQAPKDCPALFLDKQPTPGAWGPWNKERQLRTCPQVMQMIGQKWLHFVIPWKVPTNFFKWQPTCISFWKRGCTSYKLGGKNPYAVYMANETHASLFAVALLITRWQRLTERTF